MRYEKNNNNPSRGLHASFYKYQTGKETKMP